jgi:hypothetical protein
MVCGTTHPNWKLLNCQIKGQQKYNDLKNAKIADSKIEGFYCI